jgi:hypothetical protein
MEVAFRRIPTGKEPVISGSLFKSRPAATQATTKTDCLRAALSEKEFSQY